MKQDQNHQPKLLILRKALDTAKVAGHTIEEFARNVATDLAESGKHVGHPKPRPSQPVLPGEDIELVIPRIQPNELLHGWRGRVATNNCLKAAKKVDSVLLNWARKESLVTDENAGFVQCAAYALGVTQQELIRDHTLTPYFSALCNMKPNKPGEPGKRQQTSLQQAPLRIDVKMAMFCPECAREDIGSRGLPFSYWRRGHHLAGVVSCSTHAVPLLVAGDDSCFDRCPDHYLFEFNTESARPLDESVQVILLRYARISEEILESASNIDSAAASCLIRERAKAIGLRSIKGGNRKTLSTHLMDLLPLEWLEQTFPRIRWKRDKYISTIDGICMPLVTRYTTAMLCLLAAVLYDDADRALVELMGSSRKSREPFLGFDFWASREIFDSYCLYKGVVNQMAEAIGLPASTVSVGLLNQGLPGLGGRAAPMRSALRAFYAGESIETSCELAGVPKEAFIELLRSTGARLAKALDRMSDADERIPGKQDVAESPSFDPNAQPK